MENENLALIQRDKYLNFIENYIEIKGSDLFILLLPTAFK